MTRRVLLDIDGVLLVSSEPLPGAVEAIDWLQTQGIDFALVTNTSSRSRRDLARVLDAGGMHIEDSLIFTAVTSAAHYLNESFPGARCFVVNDGDLGGDLKGVALVDAPDADVVLLGSAGPGTGYDDFNAVFRLALEGAPVVALHRNTRYQTAEGPSLDMGAFIVGLEAATEICVTIVGKPAAQFFRVASAGANMDAGEVVMVGDDIGSDVLGAQAIGITGVLVKTGKFRPSDLVGPQPDHVIDDISQLATLLGELGDGSAP